MKRPRWGNSAPLPRRFDRVGGTTPPPPPVVAAEQQQQQQAARSQKRVDAAEAKTFILSLLRNEGADLVKRISGEYGAAAFKAFLSDEEGMDVGTVLALFGKDLFWVSSAESSNDITLQDLSNAREWLRRVFLVKKMLSLETFVNLLVLENDSKKLLNLVKCLASLARHDNNRSVVDLITRSSQGIIRDKHEKLKHVCSQISDVIRREKCLEILEAIANDEMSQAAKAATATARSNVPRQAGHDSENEEEQDPDTPQGESGAVGKHGDKDVDTDGFGKFTGEVTYRHDPLEPTFFDMSHRPEKFNPIVVNHKIRSIEEHAHAVFAATREDAIGPLRDNINEFEKYLKASASSNVRLSKPRQLYSVHYSDVRITNVETHRFHGVCYELTFPRMPSVNWHRTKRLAPGSLLALSADQFRTEQNTFFGVVVDQNAKQREQGIVVVSVRPSVLHPHGLLEAFDKVFDMIDSNVMWEATVHTLRTLQNNSLSLFSGLDVLLCRPGANNTNSGKGAINESFLQSLQLDPSQRKALEHCFDTRLACVQGPPGTGKSFVGVAVVRCALRYYESIPEEWKREAQNEKRRSKLSQFNRFVPGLGELLMSRRKFLYGDDSDDSNVAADDDSTSSTLGPILLVTYTNHALDSMIRDVLAAEPSLSAKPGQLIRLGQQTRDAKLEPYLLRNTMKACNATGLRKFAAFKASEEAFLRRVEEFYEEEFPVDSIKISEVVGDDEMQLAVENVVTGLDAIWKNLQADFLILNDKIASLKKEAADARDACERDKDRLEAMKDMAKRSEVKDEELSERISCAQRSLTQLRNRLDSLEDELKQLNRTRDQLEKKKSCVLTNWRDELGALAKDESLQQSFPSTTTSAGGKDGQPHVIEDEEIGVHEEEAAAEMMEHDPGVKRAAKVKKAMALLNLMAVVNGKAPPEMLTMSEDISKMPRVTRHRVYGYLRHLFMKSLLPDLHALAEVFATNCTVLQGEESDKHVSVLRSAKVIGVTTTGMSKFRDVINRLPIRIVILEEAAEIPEAHALASILPSVKMFIQIGDHQQLEPKSNCHKHSIDTRLNVSLMERLIRCKAVDYVTLTVQRRMRPEIAHYIHPLYAARMRASGVDRIEDHERTRSYPNIPGVPHRENQPTNVFFIEHKFEESGCDESATRQNPREAAFVAGLAIFFGQQAGYDGKVTVIAPYRGQVSAIRDFLRRSHQYKALSLATRERMEKQRAEAVALAARKESEGSISAKVAPQSEISKSLVDTIRIVTVDDYQGEENDIIILSLTRSKSVGFLSKNNRICVALSRARHGMVVVGFLELFRRAQWTHWPYVIKLAESTNSLTSVGMPIMCKAHGTPSLMSLRNDTFAALDQYAQLSPFGGCRQVCGQRRSPCGHICEHMCHGSECSDFACPRTVLKKFDCGHTREFPCGDIYPEEDRSKVRCFQRCQKPLDICGHACCGTCSSCHSGWHMPCQQICGRTQPCGHSCLDKCSTACSPCMQDCESSCEHSRCNRSCGDECPPCREKCTFSCPHFSCSQSCGQPCRDVNGRAQCTRLCQKKNRQCGCPCSGLCGEPCPLRCLHCNPMTVDNDDDIACMMDEDVDVLYVLKPCNHEFDLRYLDAYFNQEKKRQSVQPVVCPRCSAVVRRAFRYNSVLASRHGAIQQAKRLQRERYRAFEALIAETDQNLHRLDEVYRVNRQTTHSAHPSATEPKVPSGVSADVGGSSSGAWKLLQDTFTRLYNRWLQLKGSLHQREHEALHAAVCEFNLLSATCIEPLLAVIVGDGDRLAESRKRVFGILLQRLGDAAVDLHQLRVDSQRAIVEVFGLSGENVEDMAVVESYLSICVSSPLSNAELDAVHTSLVKAKAIRGHGAWHRCQCGYMYAIGECGGAVERSLCPQCRAPIGGEWHDAVPTSHQVDS